MNDRRISRDVVSGAAFLGLSVIYFLGTRGLPAGRDEPGPAFFPVLLSAALFVLAATILVRGWRQSGEDDLRTPVALIALTILYASTFTVVGFFLGTFVYTFGVTWLLGRRGWRAVLIPVATTTAIYVLLGLGLGVPLP